MRHADDLLNVIDLRSAGFWLPSELLVAIRGAHHGVGTTHPTAGQTGAFRDGSVNAR